MILDEKSDVIYRYGNPFHGVVNNGVLQHSTGNKNIYAGITGNNYYQSFDGAAAEQMPGGYDYKKYTNICSTGADTGLVIYGETFTPSFDDLSNQIYLISGVFIFQDDAGDRWAARIGGVGSSGELEISGPYFDLRDVQTPIEYHLYNFTWTDIDPENSPLTGKLSSVTRKICDVSKSGRKIAIIEKGVLIDDSHGTSINTGLWQITITGSVKGGTLSAHCSTAVTTSQAANGYQHVSDTMTHLTVTENPVGDYYVIDRDRMIIAYRGPQPEPSLSCCPPLDEGCTELIHNSSDLRDVEGNEGSTSITYHARTLLWGWYNGTEYNVTPVYRDVDWQYDSSRTYTSTGLDETLINTTPDSCGNGEVSWFGQKHYTADQVKDEDTIFTLTGSISISGQQTATFSYSGTNKYDSEYHYDYLRNTSNGVATISNVDTETFDYKTEDFTSSLGVLKNGAQYNEYIQNQPFQPFHPPEESEEVYLPINGLAFIGRGTNIDTHLWVLNSVKGNKIITTSLQMNPQYSGTYLQSGDAITPLGKTQINGSGQFFAFDPYSGVVRRSDEYIYFV